MNDPIMIRAVGLLLPLTILGLLWLWRQPGRLQATGVLLASIWTIPTLLLLHRLGMELNWWAFEANGGQFQAIPVDLFLAWVMIWGAIPALAFPRLNLLLVIVAMLGIDLILMPLASPVVQLSRYWWIGETVGLGTILLPAQLLARWTVRGEHLPSRVSLIALAYSGITFWVLPNVILELTGGNWQPLFDRPLWLKVLGLQAMALFAIPGLSAAQEFVARGEGTPIPFDPPKRIVKSGVYAYLANPMQLSTASTLIFWGFLLQSAWVSLAAVVAVIYSAGLAAWSENEDLNHRFGDRWMHYRKQVGSWWPSWKPWYVRSPVTQRPQARLYVAESCLPCASIGRWLRKQRPAGLTLIAAENYAPGGLNRITYDPGDGFAAENGVAALARALEHIHLGWAIVSWSIRLPLVRSLIQLLVDSVGGGPRQIQEKGTER